MIVLYNHTFTVNNLLYILMIIVVHYVHYIFEYKAKRGGLRKYSSPLCTILCIYIFFSKKVYLFPGMSLGFGLSCDSTHKRTLETFLERSILFCVPDIFRFVLLCCNTICHI